MQFTTALTTLFAAAAVTALPTAPVVGPEPETFSISDFTSRKYDGTTTATVSFSISATNGGTLDFVCAPYDSSINGTTKDFQSGVTYPCAEITSFSFAYEVASSELSLWQHVSENLTYAGETTVPYQYCHAGGSSASDEICTAVADVAINMLPC